jgi:ribA/ribD-fused uncharacterized protein
MGNEIWWIMEKIDQFEGEFRFLSNFFVAPVEYEGKVYPSSEHLYQALKTLDPEEREQVRLAATPNASKKMGKKVTMRPDWDDVKDSVMEEVIRLKFTQNPELAQKLLATGDAELIEGNWWGDDYWGVCKEEGLNKLGLALQALRSSSELANCARS